MRERWLAVATALLTMLLVHDVRAAESDENLETAAWAALQSEVLGGGPVVYDKAVKVRMPRVVWEPHSVPVTINLSEMPGKVSKVVLFAENNPIQTAAQIMPRRPIEAVGLNIRLEQTTPVRVAALADDGVWHVTNVDVVVMFPGGCSKPQIDVAEDDVGLIAMKRFDQENGGQRLKLKINHPMDTGFATDEDGLLVPAYYLKTVTVADQAGPVADLITSAALASDPSFVFDLADIQQSVRVTARDSRGLAFEALEVPPTM